MSGVKVQSTSTEKEIAAFERQFLAASPEAQTEIVNGVRTFAKLLGPGGVVSPALGGQMLALLSNIGGKMQRDPRNWNEMRVIATFQANAPKFSERLLTAFMG